jgi:hypothetical protein
MAGGSHAGVSHERLARAAGADHRRLNVAVARGVRRRLPHHQRVQFTEVTVVASTMRPFFSCNSQAPPVP